MDGSCLKTLLNLIFKMVQIYGYFFCVLSIGYVIQQYISLNSKIELTFFYFYDILKNGVCVSLLIEYLYTISYGKFKNEFKTGK